MRDLSVKVLAIVLAGGKGERLYPLTQNRAKPAVPFGGMYRLVDFVLSNLVNSGVHKVYVLTQYKSHSLLRHLQYGWVGTHPVNGFFILPVPAQMRVGESWYLGTANAVYQNIYLIEQLRPDLVLVFGADHVYFMDVGQMVQYHLERGAEITVATIPYPISECHRFGVVVVDEMWRIKNFQEKVPDPSAIPGQPDVGLVSMGNYIFDTDVLLEELARDAENPMSRHDFGGNILPGIVSSRYLYAYDFYRNEIPGSDTPNRYWRDVGTIESYYYANMDLKNPLPSLNLYNPYWPLRSAKYQYPAAKVVVDMQGERGTVENTILGTGSVVSGAHVRDSVIGRQVFIGSGAYVEESVILGHARIEDGARVRRAIIDHGAVISAGEEVGYDVEKDQARYHVDNSGIVVTPWRPYETVT
jgi:glucose-1-phosphate adenylyltransferase